MSGPEFEALVQRARDVIEWAEQAPPPRPLIPRQPPPPDAESRAAGYAALDRWEQRMTTHADELIEDELIEIPGESEFMARLAALPVGSVLVERYWPAPRWQPCDYQWLTPPGLPPVPVPCSLRRGHDVEHRFPLIRIRSRYGIVRAVCHLCTWSVTYDSSTQAPPLPVALQAARVNGRAHLRTQHHLPASQL